MLTCIFPGQGSQKLGMGKELFHEFNELTRVADDVLGYSISELCLSDPHHRLGQTAYTQPALYIVNVLSFLKKQKMEEVIPDYVAGHSLGEYSSLFAAGVFDFVTGLLIVKKRGQLMSQAKAGGMLAVIGLTPTDIQQVIDKYAFSSLQIANYNTPSELVVTGSIEDIEKSAQYFEEKGALKVVQLNVSGAFHSALMKPMAEEFDEYLSKFTFNEPKIPVISNVTAEPYKRDHLQTLMVKQLYSPVKWVDSIENLLDAYLNMEFKQIGPGRVLSNMVRKIKREYKK